MTRDEALAIVRSLTDEQREAMVLFVQEAGAGTDEGTYELECEILGVEPEPPRPIDVPPKGTFERVMHDAADLMAQEAIQMANEQYRLFSKPPMNTNWPIRYAVTPLSEDLCDE